MQRNRTTSRRWAGAVLATAAAIAVVLGPTSATAAPTTADEAADLVAQTGQELTQLDEQVHQAELTVTELQRVAADARAVAEAAEAEVARYEPQLIAIAHTGYTSGPTSGVAAFLTSDSAEDFVQQMTTLDMIAAHTDSLLVTVSAAREQAAAAQSQAQAAAAEAEAALATLEQQQAEVQARVDQYEADFTRLSAQERAAVTVSLAGPVLDVPTSLAPPPSEAAGAVVAAALAQVGDPYVWGASGPNGFDCSGLTQFAYAAAGVSLPHSSRAQAGMGVAVSRGELQPGDVVYFYSPVSHVGIYIGNGQMVHARTFGQPVAVTSVDMRGYAGARRIL
ncbi:NlpC/P60 family protein [Trujillonella endophytica]|uniref:Cell wall-associated hydrolase, NlpC family n=1 Tax=Trujillonella endophytica TaxID=673521 RepID=A0A1H8UCD6_9ACTN|nr:C40 family peptidase [Trujillella endophytica]SEP00524.1 Cell wall-associated hydrolase, NlpC family [Trujillella endophytica]